MKCRRKDCVTARRDAAHFERMYDELKRKHDDLHRHWMSERNKVETLMDETQMAVPVMAEAIEEWLAVN